jgi:CDP-diacylglycerol--glycerol-3-phosphate 3-phosphatidyltransferase
MKRHIPNALTLSRLVMAIAMFALMASYDVRDAPRGTVLLDVALAAFLLAGITDVLDGYLARKLDAASALGRISDPFIDKVLVCGAFVYFAGSGFVRFDVAAGTSENVTGVATWMAVVIFAREILVTGIRGYSERHGKVFNTTVFGKSKMAVQSATIAWILFYVAHGLDWGSWARILTDVLVWITVLVTALTALVYVNRTRRLLVETPPERTEDKS